jgi:hypothetical protein
VSDHVLDAVTVVVLVVMGARLAGGVRHARSSRGRALAGDIVRGIRWRHVWPVPLVLGAVLVVASAALAVPGLDWGWWSAVGGSGNPVFGSSDRTAGTVWEWLVPLVFVAMLVPALPLFADAEERIFRRGAEHWTPTRRAAKVVQFGLVHALIGIPIGVALALSLGGAYFMIVYLTEFRRSGSDELATRESARAHTAYNGCIIAVVGVAVLITLA